MKLCRFSILCLIAAVVGTIHSASGQVINPIVQNGSPRAVINRSAPAARPIASTSIAPHVAPRPTSFGPRTISSYAPRVVGQSAPNLRPNYATFTRSLNPTLPALGAQRTRRIGEQGAISLDPATRQTELRTLTAMRERRGFAGKNRTLAAINAQRHVTAHPPGARPQFDKRESPAETARTKWHNRRDRANYSDACRRHWHEWHDRDWWHDHCNTIVFVTSGFYFLDGSYWYPAWGYDPVQTYHDYDGPIYTYGDLLPDEVIANVQVALQDTGYYLGPITGSLDTDTRAALANFQRDYGLPITGAIDEPTVETLGLQ